jgi:hypothetical protein
VDHLTLHSMVKNLDGPDKAELRKYQTLKVQIFMNVFFLCI